MKRLSPTQEKGGLVQDHPQHGAGVEAAEHVVGESGEVRRIAVRGYQRGKVGVPLAVGIRCTRGRAVLE